MDIRAYFEKLYKIEREITTEDVVIVSEATPDGGKAGVKSEVTRTVAAQLIAEGRARFATSSEIREYRESIEKARTEAEEARLAARVHVTLVSQPEFRTSEKTRPTRG